MNGGIPNAQYGGGNCCESVCPPFCQPFRSAPYTDQGRNFESTLMKEVCQLLGIVKTRTTPYHPQSDGLVERFNRTLLNFLSLAASENEQEWDLHLPMVMLAYRTSVQQSTGPCTPFYLTFSLLPIPYRSISMPWI